MTKGPLELSPFVNNNEETDMFVSVVIFKSSDQWTHTSNALERLG